MIVFGSVIPEVSFPSDECPNPEQWRCYDSEATELEVLGFLTALVRMMKPKVLIETGTYHGYGTAHLMLAVENIPGAHLHTTDIDKDCLEKARELVRKQGFIANLVTFHLGTGEQLIQKLDTIDFAFLDSDFKGVRARELRALYPKLSKGGIVAVHDTSTYHISNGGPRLEVIQAAKDLGLQLIQFDTPRGLTLLRK